MREILRLLLFLLVFTLEVRVKADVITLPAQTDVLQEPQGCLLQSIPCALKTENASRYTLTLDRATVILDADTMILRLAMDEIVLLRGAVWVQKTDGGFTVHSEFGSVRGSAGDFWAHRTAERLTALATSDPLVLMPRGSPGPLEIPVGNQNWISGVRKDGVAASGVPTVIEYRSHLTRWARLYTGGRAAFKKDVQRFQVRWRQAVNETAAFHQELAERRLASLDEEQKRRSQAQADRERQNRFFRDLFRQRNHIE